MATEQPSEPGSQRFRIVVIIGAAIALALLFLLLALSQCGGGDDDQAAEMLNPSSPTAPSASLETGTPRSVAEGDGPVAQWTFEGDATDVTGNGHDATVLGGATFVDGAASMDGADDAFQVADTPDLNPANAITVSAWWNAVDFVGAGNNGLVDKGYTSHSAPYYQYHLGVTGPGYKGEGHFAFWVAADNKIASTDYAPWTPGRLYHLVGTYDGSQVRLYVDGDLKASVPATGSMSSYGRDLYIAGFSNLAREGTDFLPGGIDEVTIWDRALSADEVTDLFTAGPG